MVSMLLKILCFQLKSAAPFVQFLIEIWEFIRDAQCNPLYNTGRLLRFSYWTRLKELVSISYKHLFKIFEPYSLGQDLPIAPGKT